MQSCGQVSKSKQMLRKQVSDHSITFHPEQRQHVPTTTRTQKAQGKDYGDILRAISHKALT